MPRSRRQEGRTDAFALGARPTARASLDSEWQWQQLYRAGAIERALQARQRPPSVDNMPAMTPEEIRRRLSALVHDGKRNVPPGTLARYLGIHPPTLHKIAHGWERASKRVCAVLSPVLRKIERGLVVVKKRRGGRGGGSSFELEYRSRPHPRRLLAYDRMDEALPPVGSEPRRSHLEVRGSGRCAFNSRHHRETVSIAQAIAPGLGFRSSGSVSNWRCGR
jgi:hypothetical protein